jgi:hypothetical protein
LTAFGVSAGILAAGPVQPSYSFSGLERPRQGSLGNIVTARPILVGCTSRAQSTGRADPPGPNPDQSRNQPPQAHVGCKSGRPQSLGRRRSSMLAGRLKLDLYGGTIDLDHLDQRVGRASWSGRGSSSPRLRRAPGLWGGSWSPSHVSESNVDVCGRAGGNARPRPNRLGPVGASRCRAEGSEARPTGARGEGVRAPCLEAWESAATETPRIGNRLTLVGRTGSLLRRRTTSGVVPERPTRSRPERTIRS